MSVKPASKFIRDKSPDSISARFYIILREEDHDLIPVADFLALIPSEANFSSWGALNVEHLNGNLKNTFPANSRVRHFGRYEI